jgi:predicted ATPase
VLVLDTCEHVIAAAAGMVEALLHASPVAHVITTSREPLKAEGEWIYPVPPLAMPAAVGDDFWRYGAVWLFALRSRASGAHVSEDRQVAAFIATICRRLDGIPLAIELAAARGGVLGIEEVAARLDERFELLIGGRRTALPRHQTLRATARSVTYCTVMGEALARTGRIGDGLIMVETVMEHSERTEERWVFAELLRVKGELLLLQGGSSAAPTAEDRFRQALDWAHRQGALSWELRAATSLAQLMRDQGRPADAMALLQPVYDRFTEGFDTSDLPAAKALIDARQ